MEKERIKEILKRFETEKDVFNWCEEYKEFISSGVALCVSSEWDYMIKKSYEDSDCPISADDLNLNDYDQLREEIIYKIKNNYKEIEEQKELREEINLIKSYGGGYLDIKEDEDLSEWVNNLDTEELISLNDEVFNLDVPQLEIYEWWILKEPLSYELEQQGEIFLNGAWGRQTTGQSISLDSCCINAFITRISRWL